MAERIWQVLIADLKSSREIPARERTEVDRALRRAVGQVARHFAGRFRLDPEVLRGDEVQAVLRRDAPALTILTYLRARLASAAGRRIELRAGIGRGSVQRLSARGPFASEGQAFHRARAERVAFQSVSKRLRAASWNEIEQAMDLLQLQSLSIMGDGQPAPREGGRGSTHELELSVSKS